METEKTIYTWKPRWIFWGIISALFLYGGIRLLPSSTTGGWAIIGLFGLLLLICILQLFPLTYIRLNSEGIYIHGLLKSGMYRWQDIKGFNVYRNASGNHGKMIGIIHEDAYLAQKNKTMTSVNKWFGAGADTAVQDIFEVRGEKLAQLLTEWLERYKK